MFRSRRDFLTSSFTIAAAAALGARAQSQGGQAGTFGSGSAADDPFNAPFPGAKFNPRDLLAANQKNIKKDVTRLSEIVQQLQKQLEDNDTKDVLPLDVLKKTDEIEKIARHINSLLRG